jgi:tetratricopeptide (TPR) repeat protein
LFRAGKVEQALKEYQRILELKADDLETRRIIGDLLIRLNRTSEAITQFVWIADYYLKEGFFPRATAMYKRITQLDPQNESISFKLADLYSKQGLVQDAKQIYLELAEEYKRQNSQKKALNVYKKILEFDRTNIKMRLVLANGYFKENMREEAVNEFLAAAEIHLKKREFAQAEELLLDTYNKIKNLRVFEKLIACYIAQGKESNSIQLLRDLGEDIYKHVNLLKMLGELYFKNNQIEEAEKIFMQIAKLDSSETEVIMKLGKVYLQREEYDKAFQLFLPTVDNYISENKYDEANSLLRFIITSNNTYLPALNKLADIFKLTGKTNSLIALYESLIPIYETNNMDNELRFVLQQLIDISDAPFAYQEQLSKLNAPASEEDRDRRQEREFIAFQMRNVDLALKTRDFVKAVEMLQNAQNAFPRNLEIRLKLFDVCQLANDTEGLLNEGIEILRLYKEENRDEEYKSLLDKLTRLKPNDERLLDLSGHEKTNIEIDFDHDELMEQINELKHPGGMPEPELPAREAEEEDVFVLTGEDSVQIHGEPAYQKGLSSHLAELDFYISEGYFDNAEEIVVRLQKDYPESRELASRLSRIQKARQNKPEAVSPAVFTPASAAMETLEIEPSIAEETGMQQQFEDSRAAIDLPDLRFEPAFKETPAKSSSDLGMDFEIEMEGLGGNAEEPIPDVPELAVDREELVQSPSVAPRDKPSDSGSLGSSADFLNLDNILNLDESEPLTESPFKDIDEHDLAMESAEDLLRDDEMFAEESYWDLAQPAMDELAAIKAWTGEVQKQRTSTIEKNMMEIFREFKKGVDEKIGSEDYDTRYNLGIAYKEMGLVEEAIHEFLISAKHPLKFFDSAGLLGICFRDKGMLEEAIGWFEKALESPDRRTEEYKAVKYELIVTSRMRDDFPYAKKLAREIIQDDPNYRNIREIYEEIKNL